MKQDATDKLTDGFPFFESIRLQDGVFHLLPWHQARMERTIRAHFEMESFPQLNDFLNTFIPPQHGCFKFRISYGKSLAAPELIPYRAKSIRSLRLVFANDLDYSFKSTNRQQLDTLLNQRGNCDDVLIIKNGQVTDTSYCNIVFFDGKRWITPSRPLLEGVQRAFLIQKGIIQKAEISAEDLFRFQSFQLINAMLPWESAVEVPIHRFTFQR